MLWQLQHCALMASASSEECSHAAETSVAQQKHHDPMRSLQGKKHFFSLSTNSASLLSNHVSPGMAHMKKYSWHSPTMEILGNNPFQVISDLRPRQQ